VVRCRLRSGSEAPTFCGCERWLCPVAGSRSWFFLGGNRFVCCRCWRLAYPLAGGNSGPGSRTLPYVVRGWVGPSPTRVHQVSGRDRVAPRRWNHGLVRSRVHLVVLHLQCWCASGWFSRRPVLCARPCWWSGLPTPVVAAGRVDPHVSRASVGWDACS
jgi:hypothetical protein